MSRVLSYATCTCLLLAHCAGKASAAETVLPHGDARAAVEVGHFPSRIYAFVWRNWNVVPVEKLAAILGATTADVSALAASMGLPPSEPVAASMRERGYITLIRRNWHLLPYEQLLELLDMTPERLAVMLREEDFLWVKLGQVKPQCEPLRYRAPTEEEQRRASEIKAVVEAEFGDTLARPAEPRFDFVRQLATPLSDDVAAKPSDENSESLRLVYSYVALYGDPLANPKLDPYPDGLLQRLAACGINGVWLHAVLRDLAPGGEAFPEFGEGHTERLANLKTLVDRAKQFGIAIYLYINEPRAMPTDFFANRPDMAGVREGDFTALCTSHPAVRAWMRDALEYVFREVPGLGGIYAITASENLTNCASHGAWTSCDRCKTRSDADIITEVVSTIEEGVHRGSPNARVLISDWGWRGHGDAPDFIARLPKSVYLISVSEWHLPIERGGVKTTVGEYSISAVGPGPRALPHWKAAREAGLRIGADIHFNNTCELASLPYLPVMDLVAEHMDHLREAGVRLDAMFIGWTMGGYPSPNIRLARTLSRNSAPETSSALDALARERFDNEGAPHARKAWTLISDAYREYPFHISVVYTSPVQCGPANLLYLTKTGYSATMWGLPYDDLDGWRGPYPPEVFAAQFDKVASGFKTGIESLEQAVASAPAERRGDAESDLRLARAASIHFQSVANQARFVRARDALAAGAEDGERLRAEMRSSVESEIALSRELYALACEDSRIGFEPSCQYFYLPLDLAEKVVRCRWILRQI